MIDLNKILAKHQDSGGTPLINHLRDVSKVAEKIAIHFDLDPSIAIKGALLHDIGKVSPIFQQSLKRGYTRPPGFIFRHEIASLFFLSLVEEEERGVVVEMIAAHHKSISKDIRDLGLLDLDDNEDSYSIHIKGFEQWSPIALSILESLGIKTRTITLAEARDNYDFAVSYCKRLDWGYSPWKGLLNAADHFASALDWKTEKELNKLFIKPDLSFYDRKSDLYPLSKIETSSQCQHTLVTAPTGAGKTDFLLRRCKGRVFYTLPFQASINAMYNRIKRDLSDTDSQIYLLHGASSLVLKDGLLEERILQRHIGASVKVLTPHQIASVVYGIKGYEAMCNDLQGCDIILDEIHTYSDVIQSIVLKIIELLLTLNCRIHIGTATMPTLLYDRILSLLGGEDKVYQVKLDTRVLESFNRHIIHKVSDFESCSDVLIEAIERKQKILIVCNQVKRSQERYQEIQEQYPNLSTMLIHSRFKRGRRQVLESKLMNEYNSMNDACIVVTTQVVEVSLDISFDLMITECAPIDSLIQRFGRVNRKRTSETIGHYKPIYVIKPSEEDSMALPYSLDVLKRSFEALPNDELLREIDTQSLLDKVYTNIDFTNIDYTAVAFLDGEWVIKKLCHKSKSALLETLEIDSAVCITESDKFEYREGNKLEGSELEIPVSFRSVGFRGLSQVNGKSRAFVIPEKAYDEELGFLVEYAKPEFNTSFEIL
ncbi:MAG: CRISPR-associated helicase Cas3' [Bacteroidales bacterium]